MSFFRRKQTNDPANNDFSKISQEIKNSPEKLSEAQKLFKNNESLRQPATDFERKESKKDWKNAILIWHSFFYILMISFKLCFA